MPRAGGVYSAPPGTEGAPNTTIDSSKYNAFVADLVADANAARPRSAGGTGATTAIGGSDNLNTTSSSLASAATVDLANATGVVVNITGTTTIEALGTVSSGALRILIFADQLTLTHDATSLILPGGDDITTAAGDVATFRSKGSGNWKCVAYQRANGRMVVNSLDSPTITGNVTVTSTDATADAGPLIDLVRDSTSPAASDFIGGINFTGEDSAGNAETYAQILGKIVDPTSTSEDGMLDFRTDVAGTRASRAVVAQGIYTPNATGGDKGIDTINVSAVYVDGARLGGAPDAVLEDQKTADTNGGTLTSGAWRTRDLNTEVRDPAGLITLSSNQFTSTVNGWVEWSAPAYQVNSHKTRLYNVTDSTVAAVGTTAFSGSGPDDPSQSISVGGAAVAAGKTYRIEHRSSSSQNNNGMGTATDFGEIEVYTRVMFWRTA